VITDCAVCHVPERSPRSLYKLLSVPVVTLDIAFDAAVPEAERGPWREALLARLARTSVEVRTAPAADATPIRIRVAVTADAGRTPDGRAFHAARARAVVRLHRASVEVDGAPGVAAGEAEAIRRALADLADRVAVLLSW
jgi:hypothetical protein